MAVNGLFGSDLVLAGGVNTMNDVLMHICFQNDTLQDRVVDAFMTSRWYFTWRGCHVRTQRLVNAEIMEWDLCCPKSVGSSSDGRSRYLCLFLRAIRNDHEPEEQGMEQRLSDWLRHMEREPKQDVARPKSF